MFRAQDMQMAEATNVMGIMPFEASRTDHGVAPTFLPQLRFVEQQLGVFEPMAPSLALITLARED